jgi:hypothetical protein
MEVKTNEELGKALKNEVDEIEISVESAAGKTTLKIKAKGRVAWAACFSSFAVAVVAVVFIVGKKKNDGGDSHKEALMALPAMGLPIALLGWQAAVGAVAIAIAGGGVGALNKLRKYKMEERDGKIILKRK